MKLTSPKLIVICGWPLSGKSTTAKLVAEALNDGRPSNATEPAIHVADIDPLRHAGIGLPYPHSNESRELAKKDGVEMGGAYALLIRTIEWHLEVGRSLIVTATFSRRSGQERLLDLYSAHFRQRMSEGTMFLPSALRIIQCVPSDDSPEEVAKLFEGRRFGTGYVGGVNSPERYFEVRNRYEQILLPHLKLTTWPAHTPTECAAEALGHILS